MKFHTLTAYLSSTSSIDILDATHDVKRALRESGILNGLLTVFVPGNTAGVVILENESSLKAQLKEMLISFAPDSGGSRPVRRSGSGKDEAHLRSALLAKSVGIPIKDGKLLMGAWQEVIVYDFDDKLGRRDVIMHVMGDGAEEKDGKK
jgi:secondary thiamine-phosphate synthase enzyme